jgi:CHAT domain
VRVTGLRYVNLDVAVEDIGGRYRARAVFEERLGRRDFTLPFEPEALDTFLRAARSLSSFRGRDPATAAPPTAQPPTAQPPGPTDTTPPAPDARSPAPMEIAASTPPDTMRFGRELFDAVFADEIRDCLRAGLDAAIAAGSGLRIRLRLEDAPKLIDLPWELLHDGKRFLALSARTPIVRFLDLPDPLPPLQVNKTMRLLVMISNPPGSPPLDVEKEWSNLQGSLAPLMAAGRVELHRMPRPTLDELQQALLDGTFQVFYFIGHGTFVDDQDEGYLLLEDAEGGSRPIKGEWLATHLRDHSSLRLVVLNSCEGGATSASDPFGGIAQRLVQLGIPCVVAMQSRISDPAAISFSRGFYRAVASGRPADEAVAEGRKSIYTEVSELEWVTPVLYTRVPDADVFEVDELSVEERRLVEARAKLAAFWRPGEWNRVTVLFGKRDNPFLEEGEVEPVVGLPYAVMLGEVRRFLTLLYSDVVMTDRPEDVAEDGPVIALGGPVVNPLTRSLWERERIPVWFDGFPYRGTAPRALATAGETYRPELTEDRGLVSDIAFFVRIHRPGSPPRFCLAGCYGAGTLAAARYVMAPENVEALALAERTQGVVRAAVAAGWDPAPAELLTLKHW